MPSTDEWWSFDGVSLHEQGWSVTTVGDDRYDVPPSRGDNARAAGIPGEIFLSKEPDARDIGLSMFLIGADPATGNAVDDPRRQFNDSWDRLRKLFWTPERECELVRRWWRTNPATGQGEIAQAAAMAQLATQQGIKLSMTGRTRGTFTVPLHLAHPFFYGPTVTTTIAGNSTVTITMGGDYAAWSKYFYLDVYGPFPNGWRLTNTGDPAASPAPVPVVVGSNAAVGSTEKITLDVRQFLALSDRSSTTATPRVNRTGEIYNYGARPWMALRKGVNRLTLSAAGGGHAVLRFRTPYL